VSGASGDRLLLIASASLLLTLGASDRATARDAPLCRGVTPTIIGDAPRGRPIHGTPGDDVIVGDGAQNLILAGGGDDLVCGRGKDDLIAGQGGDDAVFGQGANDILFGNARDDRVSGGAGDDRLNGGGGYDRCSGGEGKAAYSPRTCEKHPASRAGGMRHLYYLGNNFARYRYPLTGFASNPGYFGANASSFLYGHPHGSWPVEIQIWGVCRRWPGAYPRRLEVFPFRGAKAAWNYFGGALEIYTRQIAIVIFAYTHKVARAAGREVRDVVDDGRGRLPPPADGALDGSLACQSHP
jgi:Ca2+-binding RTX toxin-like protein